MVGLLTWPAYGTQLRGAQRGGLVTTLRTSEPVIPEPDPVRSANQQRSLKWPAVRLDVSQRHVVLDDLHRVAKLRSWTLHAAVIAEDHAHVLFEFDANRDTHRLTQLIKGATSRALSVALGDPAARSTADRPLAHRKWWGRQSVLQIIETDEARQAVLQRLHHHSGSVTHYFAGDHES